MPTPPTTIADYCALVVKSKLLNAVDVQAFLKSWRAENPNSETEIDGFRKAITIKKLLTNYQATLIARGHTEGFSLGPYTILDRIGKGQSAGVYKAKHHSGQVIALKILPGSKVKDEKAYSRFQREARLMMQFNHPNVVRAYQEGRAGSVAFIVMDFIDGETLAEVLDSRLTLRPSEAVRLITQAFAGLQHLHEKNIVHRDLKPANMMLTGYTEDSTEAATLKILDVGISRERIDEEFPKARDIQLTTEGTILGTPDYLAPEQARDPRNADIRSDIYSLGCVLYHMICGRPPFEELNVMAQMVKHATAQPLPLSKFAKDVPLGLQEVLNKILAKKPEDRYPTPETAAKALAPFLPVDDQGSMASDMLPTFKAWLETEANMEMPAELKKPLASGTGTDVLLPNLAEVEAKASRRVRGGTTAPIPSLQDPNPAMVDVNVELVPWPPPAPAAVPVAQEPRSLLDPDRRDFLMLGFGAGGVIFAGALGLGLARLLRTPKEPPKDDTAPTS
ncbi:MAG: serine/threonine-protein kinase [Fimbriiglobus sp.]